MCAGPTSNASFAKKEIASNARRTRSIQVAVGGIFSSVKKTNYGVGVGVIVFPGINIFGVGVGVTFPGILTGVTVGVGVVFPGILIGMGVGVTELGGGVDVVGVAPEDEPPDIPLLV
jgi:hypothetical protein